VPNTPVGDQPSPPAQQDYLDRVISHAPVLPPEKPVGSNTDDVGVPGATGTPPLGAPIANSELRIRSSHRQFAVIKPKGLGADLVATFETIVAAQEAYPDALYEIPRTAALNPDGSAYWDGKRWVSTLSADRRKRWSGTEWVPLRKRDFLTTGDGTDAVVEYDERGAQVSVGQIRQEGSLFRAYRHDNSGHDPLIGTFRSLSEARSRFLDVSEESSFSGNDPIDSVPRPIQRPRNAGTKGAPWGWILVGLIIVGLVAFGIHAATATDSISNISWTPTEVNFDYTPAHNCAALSFHYSFVGSSGAELGSGDDNKAAVTAGATYHITTTLQPGDAVPSATDHINITANCT
jgi:hypothetical protein